MALNKITPSNINMPALVEELENQYNITPNTEGPAYVSDIPSQLVAKAATVNVDGNDVLVSDKETVAKALALYDPDTEEVIPSDEVVTLDNANEIIEETLSETQAVYNKQSGDSILSLRSELYSLISTLTKKGILKNYGVNNGYYDAFSSKEIKYNTNMICTAVGVGSITGGYVSHIIVPDTAVPGIKEGLFYIVEKVFSNGTKLYELAYVDEITDIGNYRLSVKDFKGNPKFSLLNSAGTYTETPTLNFYEIRGQIINNSFSFSVVDDYTEIGTEHEVSFEDDTITTMMTSITNVDGLAVSLRIPASKVGNLKTFSVYGKPVTGASTLRCYVLPNSEKGDSPLSVDELYENEDSYVIAKSEDVYIAPYVGSTNAYDKITFSFRDPIDNKYKAALENDTYLFVIVPVDSSATGTWDMLYSRNPNAGDDTQTNNVCYTYRKNSSNVYIYEQKSNNADLLYSVIITTVEPYSEIGYKNGLYSTPEIVLTDNVYNYSVSLIVNREGLFTCTDDITGDSLSGTLIVPFANDSNPVLQGIINTNYIGNNYGFKSGDTIIVGDQPIVINSDSNDNTLDVNTDLIGTVHFHTGDKVYKVGYKVFALCYNHNNPDTTAVAELKLTKVVKKTFENIPTASDELIFTAPASVQLLNADMMKVVVAWSSDAPNEYFGNSSFSNHNFIGRIYQLVVSVHGIDNFQGQ